MCSQHISSHSLALPLESGEQRPRALAQTWLLGSIPSTGVGEELSPKVYSMILFAPKFRKAISSL